MKRLFRVTAAFVAMFLVISGARYAPSAAAQDGAGITSETSYESPTFGFEVEWDPAWEAQEDGTTTDSSGDTLSLFSEEYGTAVTITALEAGNGDVDSYLETYHGYLDETYDNLTDSEFETGEPDAPAFLVTYEIDGTAIDDYVQTQIVGGTLILTSVRTSEALGLIAAAVVSTQITLDGETLLPSFGSTDEPVETPEPEETADDPKGDRPVSRDETPIVEDGFELYESPTFDVTLSYDPELWAEEGNESAEENSNGRDVLYLESTDEDIPANLYFETYDSATKASDCFDTALSESVGEIDDAEPIEDRSGDPIEGSSRGVKYGAYTYETSGGDTQAAYIECRALPGGAGVLAITLITLEDTYDDAFDELSDILDTVALEEGGDEPVETPEPDETPDTPANSGDYESPTYGFTIEYSNDWEAGDATTDGGLDQFVLEGPDAILLLVRGFEAGSRETTEDCVATEVDRVAQVLEVEVTQVTNTDTDEPIAGEDAFGYYSLYAYEGESGTRMIYAECGQSPDGDYFVSFIAEFPVDSLSSAIDEVTPIIETVNF